jgi:PRD1 phage membrane DNA delivery
VGDQLIASVVTVATAIVGLAIIAVLVSNKASTAGVITAGGNAFANDLSAATNPFSGGSGFSAPAGLQF